jgi:hypothetical protein
MLIKATEWPTGIRQAKQELQLEALKKVLLRRTRTTTRTRTTLI